MSTRPASGVDDEGQDERVERKQERDHDRDAVEVLLHHRGPGGRRTEAATEQREIPEPERQLADVIRRLRDAWLERQIALRNGRLADPTLDDDERLTLLSELQALRLRKRSALEPIA